MGIAPSLLSFIQGKTDKVQGEEQCKPCDILHDNYMDKHHSSAASLKRTYQPRKPLLRGQEWLIATILQNAIFIRRYKHFCVFFGFFCIFGENSKWLPFWERRQIFKNWAEYITQIPCGWKILMKSLYLLWLRRQKQICIFAFKSFTQNS